MKKQDLKVIRVLIIVCIILVVMIPLLIFGEIFALGMLQGIVDIANNETAENSIVVAENSTETAENIVEEPKYVLVESFANPDTFYDLDWTPRKYIEYIVEEDGTYLIETNEKVGANYLVYITDSPISDLGKYQGNFEIVQHTAVDHISIKKDLRKGQYIYIVQGDSKTGTAFIKRLETQ